jgi:hypothetical protein
MIEGGLLTDVSGILLAAALYAVQRVFRPPPDAMMPVKGAD